MERDVPLSFVATSRNDGHGGDLLGRMQQFVDALGPDTPTLRHFVSLQGDRRPHAVQAVQATRPCPPTLLVTTSRILDASANVAIMPGPEQALHSRCAQCL